jgi:hypothetical protein
MACSKIAPKIMLIDGTENEAVPSEDDVEKLRELQPVVLQVGAEMRVVGIDARQDDGGRRRIA